MKTKINLNGVMENLKGRETLIRDYKSVKVKTAIRAGFLHFKY
jgi:hypothetical protein